MSGERLQLLPPEDPLADRLIAHGRCEGALALLEDFWKSNANVSVSSWEDSYKAWREKVRQALVTAGLIFPGSSG